jgi:ATP-dependent Lon protease
VIIPDENTKDLADIPKNVTQGLEIIPVKWIDQVLDIALVRPIAVQAGETPVAVDAVEEQGSEGKTDNKQEPARPH